jgi:hypothetical protein
MRRRFDFHLVWVIGYLLDEGFFLLDRSPEIRNLFNSNCYVDTFAFKGNCSSGCSSNGFTTNLVEMVMGFKLLCP